MMKIQEAQRHQALLRAISRVNNAWRKDAAQAVVALYDKLDAGIKIEQAVTEIQYEYPALFTLSGLKESLVEVACYGAGIVPGVLIAAQAKEWGEALSVAWSADGMKLSVKLHGASKKMRNAIIDTVRSQMRKNHTWIQSARALYDGYNAGHVAREQQIAEYMKAVRNAALSGNSVQLRVARTATRNIQRLSRNGAPNQALKSAYKKLLDSAMVGSDKQLKNAVRVAVHEKSRYVAERITRTEMARAYADGFMAAADQNPDIVGMKIKLSSRHPECDICDMYAEADFSGMGAGAYPKEKVPPLPIHPHCLCRYSEIYKGEAGKPHLQIQEGGDAFLKRLNKTQLNQILGKSGAVAWEKGKDWQTYARGWIRPKRPESRLTNYFADDKMFKIILQMHAKKISDYPTIRLSKKEYAHVMSELNTHLSEEQRKRHVVVKAIGNYVYTLENLGFNNYRIIGKSDIDDCQKITDILEE